MLEETDLVEIEGSETKTIEILEFWEGPICYRGEHYFENIGDGLDIIAERQADLGWEAIESDEEKIMVQCCEYRPISMPYASEILEQIDNHANNQLDGEWVSDHIHKWEKEDLAEVLTKWRDGLDFKFYKPIDKYIDITQEVIEAAGRLGDIDQ